MIPSSNLTNLDPKFESSKKGEKSQMKTLKINGCLLFTNNQHWLCCCILTHYKGVNANLRLSFLCGIRELRGSRVCRLTSMATKKLSLRFTFTLCNLSML